MKDLKKNLYRIDNLIFSYFIGDQKIEAIRGLTLAIPEASLTTISGPSGSGKSTLLSILGLIEPVQEGAVFFQNEDIGKMDEKRKNHLRKFQIGFIFQQFHLFPILNAEENVKYFLSRQGLSSRDTQQRAEEALNGVGLWEHRMKKPSELSGGQKQRVAIARAIAKHPAVIIGDEPTGSLDQKTGHEIMDILQDFVETKKSTVILTTHDAMVQSFATHNFHIQDGRLASCGSN
jgi:ABC-type lipoprotein export system ATPase subunit